MSPKTPDSDENNAPDANEAETAPRGDDGDGGGGDGDEAEATLPTLPTLPRPPEGEAGLSLVRLLAAGLAARGVRFAFGVPGGDVLQLIAALEAAGVRFILARHEGSAGFMADAAYQRTGAPGLCIATLGPGAMNLVTGVANAKLERSRLVAITGRAPVETEGSYTHQVLDQVAVFAPITRRSVSLTEESGFLQVLTALAALDREPPGPLHFDLPPDVAERPQPGGLASWLRPRPPKVPSLHEQPLAAAAALLRRAQRPALLVGCAATDPQHRDAVSLGVEAWAEASGCPVLTSFRAKGALPEDHPSSAGCLGLSPVVDAVQQALLAEADLIITLGLDPVELRSAWLPGWPPTTPVLRIEPYDGVLAEEGEAAAGTLTLIGEPAACLDALQPTRRSAWTPERLEAHRAALEAPFADGPEGPATAVRAVQSGAPDDVLAAVDVGAHRITLSHTWRCSAPGTLLQSNGLCTMGTALPMAISMKLHEPGRPVLAVVGDGGLLMGLGELSLAAELGIDLVVVVFVDRSLSLIALKQERMKDAGGAPLRPSGVGLRAPDFVGIVEAMGGRGQRARGGAAVEAATRRAFAEGGLQLIAVEIDERPYRAQM